MISFSIKAIFNHFQIRKSLQYLPEYVKIALSSFYYARKSLKQFEYAIIASKSALDWYLR